MIYFDNAATTISKPEMVAEAVYKALLYMGNEGRGANHASLFSSMKIYETREKLASLFHAPQPDHIIFTHNATESLNTAINGSFGPGDHVITTALEHNSVLRPLYRLAQKGLLLTIMDMDEMGKIDLNRIQSAITPMTKGIVCTHGSNVTGQMLDIQAVGNICKERDLRFIVDASQTAGMFPIDMKTMSIDVLCFTGHKSLYGPQGTGGMALGPQTLLQPLKVGGSGMKTFMEEHPSQLPNALEAGTLNGHGIVGLGAALDYIKDKGMDTMTEQALHCMWHLFHGINDIPGVKILGDFSEQERCPIVSFNIKHYASSKVGDVLQDKYHIATRTGGHCAPLVHKGFQTEEQGAVRMSFSHTNTIDEVNVAIQAIKEIAM